MTNALSPAVARVLRLNPPNVQETKRQLMRLLEDRRYRAQAAEIWAHVRANGGALRTVCGVLVGSDSLVGDVLHDSNYSVEEYGTRMAATFGRLYLGLDGKSHKAASTGPNALIRDIQLKDAFGAALEIAQALLRPLASNTPLDLRSFTDAVIAGISTKFFGLPDGTNMVNGGASKPSPSSRCPMNFRTVSQFVFHPWPNSKLEQIAKAQGTEVKASVANYCTPLSANTPPFVQALRKDSNRLQSNLVGVINGFVVPTSGSFLSIIAEWTETRELWRWRTWFSGLPDTEKSDPAMLSPLKQAMLRSMIRRPVPDLLHRKVVEAAQLGGIKLNPEEQVIISLASAAQDKGNGAFLFGGTASSAIHACPGQAMAFGTLLGMMVALLDKKQLRYAGHLLLRV